MSQDTGGNSGSCPTGQAPAGLDASRCDPGRKHRAKMARKKAARASCTTGFTPVRNGRIAARHALQVMTLVQLGVTPIEAEQQAWRNVAKTLPAPRMVRDYSRKPSKNGDPAYRKSIWPAAKIARREGQSA